MAVQDTTLIITMIYDCHSCVYSVFVEIIVPVPFWSYSMNLNMNTS